MQDTLTQLRTAIRQATYADEPALVGELLTAATLAPQASETVRQRAIELVERCRGKSDKAGTLDAFLQEFGLSNKEGIALMCLAESLLRVPDEETADRLIAEKILSGDWASHKGKSGSRFVNASVWGLMLTGRVVTLDDEITRETNSWMKKLVSSLGEPVVRRAVLQAMRIMGGQYVLGRNIEEAIAKGSSGNRPGTRFSFDMLGEGARTADDARRYFEAYAEAIRRIIATSSGASVVQANGISVKLSALHPRYEFRQKQRVMNEVLPRVRELALMAKQGRIGLSIDAEECDRLDISLDIFEALARDPELAGWDGLGFVLQAYQKRATHVARWLIELARNCDRRFMVRLVKGAYWDGEIKHAQEQGMPDYPVFTRKCHTDVSYQACAAILLAAPDEIYSQFATHNAHTVALILELGENGDRFEFQRLHGMGHLLYDEVLDSRPEVAVRVYAPVGNHRDLLPYLVRRLLENGANSSFVNRFLDAKVPPEELLQDPVEETRSYPLARHSRIPVPRELYRDEQYPWANAAGIDLADPLEVAPLLKTVADTAATRHRAGPIVGGQMLPGEARPVVNPADHSIEVGEVVEAGTQSINRALELAAAAQPGWDARGAQARAECLERAANLMEEQCESLIGLIAAEAGRSIDDALSEVREAVDFCRYYAQQARAHMGRPEPLPGPTGEVNELSLHGRGVFLCISPWNFPLAIFVGQVTAALAAGNSVIAKPAEQTPLIAARAVGLLHTAGVPGDVLHLLPGDGAAVGGALLADQRIAGVAFTGGTDTAKLINRQLAERDGPIVPLIAETGGLNVMLVDATALPEQVVDDVITSAFQSAGQRCSALRVLYLQEDIADNVIAMLRGAMAELKIGNPAALSTDIGPVIDLDARQMLERHEQRMKREGKALAACALDDSHRAGYFVAPQVYEIESLSQLEREVFGPVLHLIRYKVADLPRVLADINASGYGLTLGVHSRIDGFARDVFRATRVGNTYINRNMVGAVVGVNPFGGQGLSGTGPKAGGPHYLLRFVNEKTRTDNVVAKGGNTQLFSLQE
ncbi:bifunctional proline dehydrogenase/L-glutamate gamma-semialdehyde dehydrogenase PutA [Seongchinamella sediminis]|uniref:Bifunctional protein PutA n=1 Tax=Seongchinamella sediminis TaxID=2283635 RepID=A0A3L7E0Y4_9GAMM|nr:bifunctional proline dehydrogenase/L-glutamate gamma-semialdehyde dehydrogenase PutA [Seongchinamella sediminis]RLQ23166.1 bifunctional proline dehydrogenase/L-glutamate gamma-semialdehyde dehydrogenase PutA [Seongchinamella sediminis]